MYFNISFNYHSDSLSNPPTNAAAYATKTKDLMYFGVPTVLGDEEMMHDLQYDFLGVKKQKLAKKITRHRLYN